MTATPVSVFVPAEEPSHSRFLWFSVALSVLYCLERLYEGAQGARCILGSAVQLATSALPRTQPRPPPLGVLGSLLDADRQSFVCTVGLFIQYAGIKAS